MLNECDNLSPEERAKFIKEFQSAFTLAYHSARKKETQEQLLGALGKLGISEAHVKAVTQQCTYTPWSFTGAIGAISSFGVACCKIEKLKKGETKPLEVEKVVTKTDKAVAYAQLARGELVHVTPTESEKKSCMGALIKTRDQVKEICERLPQEYTSVKNTIENLDAAIYNLIKNSTEEGDPIRTSLEEQEEPAQSTVGDLPSIHKALQEHEKAAQNPLKGIMHNLAEIAREVWVIDNKMR